MHHLLEKELATFEARTPGSKAALKRAEPRMPLGVASNFRSYEPWPLFVKDAKGSHIHDLDGNEYIDFNLCFGALMAGHCHPAVVAAVQERLVTGTMYGMPHTLEYDLADEICQRFPVEQVRFGSSGTEVTMHAIRIARGFTGRDKIIKMEGGYHGVHDSVLVSMKPNLELVGDPDRPNQVPASGGVPADTVKNTLVAQFNDLKAVMNKSRELGMRTFDWALFELYNEGLIPYDEAIRNADSANELRLNIKLNSTKLPPAVEQVEVSVT